MTFIALVFYLLTWQKFLFALRLDIVTSHRYCCPICSKSVIDMSRTWNRIDEEVDLFNLSSSYWLSYLLCILWRRFSTNGNFLNKLKFHNALLIWLCFQMEATVMPEDYRYQKVITFHSCLYIITLLPNILWIFKMFKQRSNS